MSDQKAITGIYYINFSTIWRYNVLCQMILQLLVRNVFASCDPWDLWPESYTRSLLRKIYLHMKLQGFRSIGSSVITWKWICSLLSLRPWPLPWETPKTTAEVYFIRSTNIWSYKVLGKMVLQLLVGNVFYVVIPVTLTCDLELWCNSITSNNISSLEVVGETVL